MVLSIKRAVEFGELAQRGVNEDRKDHNVRLQKFARLHRHIADARLRGDRFGDDEGQPHNAERVAKADEDRGQRAGEE